MNDPIYYHDGKLHLLDPLPNMTAHYDWGEFPEAITYIVYYDPAEIDQSRLVEYLKNPVFGKAGRLLPTTGRAIRLGSRKTTTSGQTKP